MDPSEIWEKKTALVTTAQNSTQLHFVPFLPNCTPCHDVVIHKADLRTVQYQQDRGLLTPLL